MTFSLRISQPRPYGAGFCASTRRLAPRVNQNASGTHSIQQSRPQLGKSICDYRARCLGLGHRVVYEGNKSLRLILQFDGANYAASPSAHRRFEGQDDFSVAHFGHRNIVLVTIRNSTQCPPSNRFSGAIHTCVRSATLQPIILRLQKASDIKGESISVAINNILRT